MAKKSATLGKLKDVEKSIKKGTNLPVKKKDNLPEVPKFEPKYLKTLPDYPAEQELKRQGFFSKMFKKSKPVAPAPVETPKGAVALPKTDKPKGKELPVKEPAKKGPKMFARPKKSMPPKIKSPTMESFKEIDKINKELEKLNKEIAKMKV